MNHTLVSLYMYKGVLELYTKLKGCKKTEKYSYLTTKPDKTLEDVRRNFDTSTCGEPANRCNKFFIFYTFFLRLKKIILE